MTDLEKRLRDVDKGHVTVYELEKVRPLCREAADTLAVVRKWAENIPGDSPEGDVTWRSRTIKAEILAILDNSDTDD